MIDTKLKILIVDDDIINMMLAKAMVSNVLSNAEITEAVNGKIALEKAISIDFDIIFMDVQMPVMNGNEATKAIRVHEKTIGRHTIIIGVTAGALKEDRERCFRSGMDEFLTKPIDSAKLKEAITRVLSNR
jgi:CheY-like chemotaxis protein